MQLYKVYWNDKKTLLLKVQGSASWSSFFKIADRIRIATGSLYMYVLFT
jgi:hypothetical protein